MTQKYRLALAGAALALFMLPAVAAASSLSSAQASAIVGLLQAFGADESIVLQVEVALGITSTPSIPVDPPPPAPHVQVIGSLYRASNLGFDYSYNAPLFPPTSFGFGMVGVSGGKSFTQNPRINQEYNWARFGAGAPPTLYMNINAPYGSSVAGHVASPKVCDALTVGTTTEPTACAGYNYGYQAAQYAYTYAKGKSVASPLWWLDIEEANSWSADPAVNDATIQGAMDYLNAQGVRVGVYSVGYMWNAIAGSSFSPTQSIGGQNVSIPTWLPIGVTDQIGAGNACATKTSFLAGSPVWLVQYEMNSTAVDQNFAC